MYHQNDQDTEQPTISQELLSQQMLDHIAATGSTSFAHIFLYNSIKTTGGADEGIDGFIDIHANLMALHGFMAGFQYVVVNGAEAGASDARSARAQVTIALQTLGFLLSLGGTIFSLIAMEYLKAAKRETLKMQVMGILSYHAYFRLSDISAVVATFLLVASTNILIHDSLPAWLCYVFNGVSGVIFVWGFFFWKRCVVDRQMHGGGRHLYRHIKDKQEQGAAHK